MTSLKDDILALVRQKLLDENQHSLAKLPQDLEAKSFKPSGRSESAARTNTDKARLQFVAVVPGAVVAGITEYLTSSKSGGK